MEFELDSKAPKFYWGILYQVYKPKCLDDDDLLPQEGVKLTERRFLVNAASETAIATMAKARKCAKFSFIIGTKLVI